MVAVAWLLKTPAAVLKQKQNWFWRVANVAIATIAARCSGVASQQGGPIGHITNHSGKVKTGEMTNMFHSIDTAALLQLTTVPATTLYRYVDIYSPCVCWGNVVISSGAV